MRFPVRRRAVAAAIKSARKAAGLSGRQLSEKLGRVENYVHKIEHLQKGVNIEEFVAIAEACNADPEELFRRVLGR